MPRDPAIPLMSFPIDPKEKAAADWRRPLWIESCFARPAPLSADPFRTFFRGASMAPPPTVTPRELPGAKKLQ